MTTVGPPMCTWCKHFRKDWKCTAFPGRIPQAIIESEHDHRQPYPGDHGVRFDPVDADAAHLVAGLFDTRGEA